MSPSTAPGISASDDVPAFSRCASKTSSKSSPGTPSTILPYIWMNRRYESKAKRSSSVCRVSPSTDRSFSPRLRTVSIIPGIENLAPDRTETSKGSVGSPSALPMRASSSLRCSATSASRPSGQPPFMYARQASVVMVNPGGTGSSSTDVISARLAPLPPSRSFMSLGGRGCWWSNA
jgi:hypothetical protein